MSGSTQRRGVILARICLIAALVSLGSLQFAHAQLRIVTYNTNTGPRADSDTVLQSISNEVVNGFARQVDAILFQEHDNVATTTQDFVDLLNGLYGAGVYARSTVNGATGGAGRPTLVYNTQSLQLVGEATVGTISPTANVREGLRYHMRPVGYGPQADFYLYNDHYKAGSTATDMTRRLGEAMNVRADADALGEGTHIIYAGDFNIKNSFESMYGELLSAGAGQAFDPISMPGSWFNNNAFKGIHTQSPVTSSRFSGQVTGGMDDRFDFQLVSGEFLDDEGLSYIAGSYHALGNNGTHPLNGELDHVSNTALTPAELTAIANTSDHLPVVADYQLPAKMQVTVDPVPAQVITGATVDIDLLVENVAPVTASLGADELDYAAAAIGDASGNFFGSTLALSGGDLGQFTLNTAGPAGAKSMDVFVVSSSQAVEDGTFNPSYNFDVLDHANASFDGGVDDDSETVDFGLVFVNATSPSQGLSIHNLESTVGFTAALDLDTIVGSGDTGTLTTDLTTFSDLAAGTSTGFNVAVDTSAPGTFSATYDLTLSDEDLDGEMTGMAMTLDVMAQIVIQGDVNFDGKVDGLDANIVSSNFLSSGQTYDEGDVNLDGDVNGLDANIISANFGMMNSDFATAIPEPSTIVLGMVCCALATGFGRSRRKLTRSVHLPN